MPAYSSGVCCPLMQGHCQFLLISCLSVLLWLASPIPQRVAFHGQCRHFPSTVSLGPQVLRGFWCHPKTAAALSWQPPTRSQEKEQQPLGEVTGTGHRHLMNYLCILCFMERPSGAGLPSSQRRKLCASTRLHILNKLSQAVSSMRLITLMLLVLALFPGLAGPGPTVWPPGGQDLFRASRACCPRSADGLLMTKSNLPYLTIPSLYEQMFLHFRAAQLDWWFLFYFFCLHSINLSFLTWPAVPSTCARLEQCITLASSVSFAHFSL